MDWEVWQCMVDIIFQLNKMKEKNHKKEDKRTSEPNYYNCVSFIKINKKKFNTYSDSISATVHLYCAVEKRHISANCLTETLIFLTVLLELLAIWTLTDIVSPWWYNWNFQNELIGLDIRHWEDNDGMTFFYNTLNTSTICISCQSSQVENPLRSFENPLVKSPTLPS